LQLVAGPLRHHAKRHPKSFAFVLGQTRHRQLRTATWANDSQGLPRAAPRCSVSST
jgi:hypothetical protein